MVSYHITSYLIIFPHSVFCPVKVMVIGGENLPKVSTQALKQQHEKSIEEASPPKHIKVKIKNTDAHSKMFYFQ